MNIITFPLLLLGVMLNAGAQLLLKIGMTRIGSFNFSVDNLIPIGLKVATNFPIITGLTAYVISVIVWLLVLSRVDVSVAYPMLSLGYVVTALVAYFVFGENISLVRMTGIFIILVGVYMVARS